MKIETCCFTGHRKLAVDQRNEIALKLEKAVMSLVWVSTLRCGPWDLIMKRE